MESEKKDFLFDKRVIVYILFFLSGFSALIYEVSWPNRIQLFMGHTIYALSTILGAYLSGLAVGVLGAHRIIKLNLNPLFVYFIFELLIGIYGLVFFPILSGVQFFYSPLVINLDLSLPALSFFQFIFCGIVVFIPTMMMGATLPLLANFLYKEKGEMAKKIPFLYAINTFGAFWGCLAAGYIILPSLGYSKTIYLCPFINILLF